MSAKKKDKGPSTLEVALGAILSVILGAALGAGLLVFKTVQKVKEIPKDAPASAVYLVEGARDLNRTSDVADKRKAFTQGESVDIDESELNVLLGSLKPSAPAPAKAGDKAPAGPTKAIDLSALNARISAGQMQLSDTVTYNLFGISGTLIVQASGAFERRGGSFAFVPETFYVGGCPMQRIPIVKSVLLGKLLLAGPAPEDLAAAWSKLSEVTLVGNALRLKMP
jgi:hypothetical protein